jgi:hypothetical protein
MLLLSHIQAVILNHRPHPQRLHSHQNHLLHYQSNPPLNDQLCRERRDYRNRLPRGLRLRRGLVVCVLVHHHLRRG